MPSLLETISKQGPIVDVQQLNLNKGLSDFTQVAKAVSQDPQNGFWSTVKKFAEYVIGGPKIEAALNPQKQQPQQQPPAAAPAPAETPAPTDTGITAPPGPTKALKPQAQAPKGPNPVSNFGVSPVFNMPVSDTTAPFASMNPGHVLSMADAIKKGDSASAFLSQGASRADLSGPKGSVGQSLGLMASGLAVGATKGEMAAGALLQNVPGALGTARKNMPTPQDEASAPLEYKISEAIGSLGGFLLDLSAAGQIIEPVLTATGIAAPTSAIEGGKGPAMLNFLQNARARGAATYLTENFPKISSWVFGEAGGSPAAITAAVNDMTKLAISFGLMGQVKLPLTTDVKTRVTDLAQSIMTATLLGRIGLASDPFLKTGANFAYGFGMQMLQNGNKEDAFIQGALWGALGSVGGVQVTQKGFNDAAYEFSMKNIKEQAPALADTLDSIDTTLKAYDGKLAQGSDWIPASLMEAPVETAAGPVPVLPKVRTQYVPQQGDAIDNFILGKTKLRIADTGTASEWKDALGPGRYANSFRKDFKGMSTDEFAQSLGMTDNELLTEIEKRVTANNNDRNSALTTYALLNEKAKGLSTASDAMMQDALSGITVDKAYQALNAKSRVAFGDILTNDENAILKALESKGVTEAGQTAAAGEELASGFQGVKIEPDQPYMTPLEGKTPDEAINTRLRQALEVSLAGKLEEPSFIRGQRATETQKAYVKNLVAHLPDITDSQRADLRKAISDAASADVLDAIRERALNASVVKMKAAVDGGNQDAIRKITFSAKPDREFLAKILDAYKLTKGTETDLAKAVIGAAGIDVGTETHNIMRAANAAVKEFGSPDVKDFHDFLEKVGGGAMEKATSFEANRAAIMQKIEDTVRFERETPAFSEPEKNAMNEVGKYVKDESGNYVKVDAVPPKEMDEQAPVVGSSQDMDAELVKILDVSFRQERLGPGVKGKAIGDEAIILSRYRTGTTLHEAGGHIVDARFNITEALKNSKDKLAGPTMKELVDGLDPAKKDRYQKNEWLAEGFADMMKAYLGGGDISKYPLSVKMAQSAVDAQDPALWPAFEVIRQQNINLDKAPALAAANAARQANDKPFMDAAFDKAKQQGFVKTVGEGFKSLYRRELNLIGHFTDIDKQMNVDPKDRSSLSWSALFYGRMKNGYAEDIMRYGVPESVQADIEGHVSSGGSKRVTRGLYEIKNDVPAKFDSDFRSYLTALRFETENQKAQLKGITLEYPKTYSPERIAEIKATVEAEFPDAPKIAAELADFQKEMRKAYVGNRMTQDEVTRMEQFPRFASIQRKGDLFDNDFSFNKFVSTIGKHFKGSERQDVIDPWDGHVSDIRAAVSAAVDGSIHKKLYDAASFNPSDKLRTVAPTFAPVARMSPDEILGMTKKLGMDLTPEEQGLIKSLAESNPEMLPKIFRPKASDDPNVVTLWVNGEAKQVYMDRGMRDWLNAERKRSDAGFAMKAGMLSAQLKRVTATTLSPMFLITHTLREYYTTLENGERVTDNTYGLSMFTHLAGVLKGIYDYAQGAKGGHANETYDNLVRYGVIQRSRFGEDATLLNEIVAADKGGLHIASNMYSKFSRMMRGLVTASDSAGRMAVASKYDMAKPDELASGMRDAVQSGIDWNQRGLSTGELSRLNDVLGFAKAGVLAVEKNLQPFKNPGRVLAQLWPISIAALATAVFNDKNQQYANIPMSRRMASMNLPTANGGLVTLPLGNNLPMLLAWNLPQIIYYSIKNKDPRLAADFAGSVLGEMTRADFAGQGLAALQSWMPDAVQQLNALTLETTFNKNLFTGQAIVPANLQKLDPLYQKESYTSNVPVAIADGLHAITGIKVSPMQLDNFLQNSLYGSYTFFTQSTDLALDSLGISPNKLRSSPDTTSVPFLSRFVHDAYTPASQYYVQRTFSLYDQYKTINATVNSLRKERSPELANYQKENAAAIKYWPAVNDWYKRYVKTAASYRAIEGEQGLDPSVRKSQLSNITDGFLSITQQTLQTLEVFQ